MLTLATLHRTTSLFPTQFEGTTVDHRPVYIRCKHGELRVHVGLPEESLGGAIASDPVVCITFEDEHRSELDWIEIEPLTGIKLPLDSSFTIDDALLIDAGEIAHLMQRVWREVKPYLLQLNDDASVRRFVEDAIDQATVLKNNAAVRVARANRIIGFCIRSTDKVDHLYIDCSGRSRTAGSRLLGETLIGAATVRLEVLERNTAAHAFYRHRGFIEEQRTKTKTGETQIAMLWKPGLRP